MMTQKHLNEFSYKTVRNSSNFLHSVWRHNQKCDIEANVYRDYMKNKIGKFNFVNDFLSKSWKKTSELSHEQVICIHEDNKIKAFEGKSRFIRKDLGHDGKKCRTKKMFDSPFTDMEVTDEFLDCLQIAKGKREERIAILKKQSEIFFHFLCIHIGTERTVKFRRLLLNTYVNIPKSAYIIGSKSEGLNMPGSDTDMLNIQTHSAREKGDNSHNGSFLDAYYTYDSLMSNVYPGYVILEINDNSGEFESSHVYKKSIEASLKKSSFQDHVVHGPALMTTTLSDDFDKVIAVQSETWPIIADEWIHRKRKFGWPSGEMITSIIQKGCFIVPVGSSRDHDNNHDWRLSFCLAEQELISTFNHSQMLVYGVLKLVLKEIIDTQNIAQLICSYILKTVMFWVIEGTSSSYWIPHNILLCLNVCIRRLIQFVIEENCPNYFVTGNNMFHKRFNTSSRGILLNVLCEINCNGWQWVLQTETLKKFPYYIASQESNIEMIKYTSHKREHFDMYDLLLEIVIHCRQRISLFMSRHIRSNFKSFLSNVCKVPMIRQKTIPVLSHFIDTNNQKLDNKIVDALRKFQWQLLMMDFTDNIITGKLSLASWLHMQGKHNECSQITDACLKNIDLCMCHDGKRIMRMDLFEKVLICTRDCNDLHYLSSYEFMVPENSYLVVSDLSRVHYINAEFTNKYVFHIYYMCPRSYMHFLRCLCFFRIGDEQKCEYEYAAMNSVCETSCSFFKPFHKAFNLHLIVSCNKIRRNIKIDLRNKNAIVQHHHALGLTIDNVAYYLELAVKIMQEYRIANNYLYNFLSTGFRNS